MSLEDMSRKARRKNNKQDKANPGARKKKQIETNEAIQRRDASQSLSAAQKKAAGAPSIRSVGTDSFKTGDAPLEVRNDNGHGTHMEYPGNRCTEAGCKAAFHEKSGLDTHNQLYHGPDDQLIG
jgi:hypothetical protein